MEWGTFIAVAGTLAGIILGNRLSTRAQHEAEVRARREAMYVEWVKFLNGLPDRAMDALIEGEDRSSLRREVSRRLNAITAEISVFASHDVRQAWNAVVTQMSSPEYRTLMEQSHKETEDIFDFFQHAWARALNPEKSVLLQAMRRDLGTLHMRRRRLLKRTA